jgi:hypothetical protein
VWQHTIRNACQDHILPHPLHNPITIFNIHHNAHCTTLIADRNYYSYYDPLNSQTPRIALIIYNTLRQWYSDHSIAPPLLRYTTPPITAKSTPQQTDNWSCCLHMLLNNLSGSFPPRALMGIVGGYWVPNLRRVGPVGCVTPAIIMPTVAMTVVVPLVGACAPLSLGGGSTRPV